MFKELIKPHHQRNAMLRNNIFFSGILKLVGLGISFLLVPLTLGYLSDVQFGIWLVMSSVLYWVETFDIGLGNGMRNYLSAALSRKDWVKARSYLATTMAMLSVIALLMGVVCVVAVYQVSLQRFFNTTAVSEDELRRCLLVAVLFTLVMFVVKNIGVVFISLQKYALSDMIKVVGNAISLLLIYGLTKVGSGSLFPVVFVFTFVPILMFFISTIPLFRHYPDLRPHRCDIDRALGRSIVGKGLSFFFIQITSCLVIYGCANFFVTQYCGPAQVTVFNIAYKYFNLLVIGFLVVVSPLWSAYTDALVQQDYDWIVKTLKRSLWLWGLTVVGGLVLLAGSGLFYRLWVGSYVDVPFGVSLSVWAYISLFNLNTCLTMLINGMNKLRVQMLTSGVGTLLYLLLVHVAGTHVGVAGIVWAMALIYGGMSLVHLRQCLLLSRNKATGIWNQ